MQKRRKPATQSHGSTDLLCGTRIARLPKVTSTILCFPAWLVEARSFYRMPTRQGCAVPQHGTPARRHTSLHIEPNPFSPVERLKGITDPQGFFHRTPGICLVRFQPPIVFRTSS